MMRAAKLRLMEGFVRETKEEGIGVVKERSCKAVKEYGSGLGGKRRAEAFDIVQVKKCKPGDFNVGVERRYTGKDDTETLDLREPGNSAVVNGQEESVSFG